MTQRLPLALVLFFLFVLTACSLDKPGVRREPYQPVAVPKLFDRAVLQVRDDGQLWAGVKVVDITPRDREAWVAGFGPGRKSRGVLDPVTARIVYLHDGREAVVLIAFDLVGMVNNDVNRLRARITDLYPERVQVTCTHNHEAPDSVGYWGAGLLMPLTRGVDTDWLAKTFQDVALGVNDAIASAQPVRVALGQTEIDSRWVTNMWFPAGTGPRDARMGVIRLETFDGAPLATIANFACHAETLLDINKQVSADFPGRFDKYCEAMGGGTPIFLPGALGGMISPYICRFDQRPSTRDLAGRIAWMDDFGRHLAERALAAVADAPRRDTADVRLRTTHIDVPMRNALFVAMANRGILPKDGRAIEANTFRSEVGYLRLGGASFAFVPGEAFPDLGMKLKAMMPYAEVPFVVSLTNDELGYIMLPEQWEDPHYGYERSMSVGRHTATIITDAFADLVGGRW